jgi:hypothetical protein
MKPLRHPGLSQKVLAFLEFEIGSDDFRAVAAAKDDFQTWIQPQWLRGKFPARYSLWHYHVRQQQMNGRLLFVPNSEGFDAIGSVEDMQKIDPFFCRFAVGDVEFVWPIGGA